MAKVTGSWSSRGGFTTKIHLRVNAAGLPMRSDITPDQTSDDLGFDLVMDNNLPEPCVLLADRGHDSDKVFKSMKARNVVPVIPMRRTRKLRVAVGRTLYRLHNLVARCFNTLKKARRDATRCDKTAESFLGFIDITLIHAGVVCPASAVFVEGGTQRLKVLTAARLTVFSDRPRRHGVIPPGPFVASTEDRVRASCSRFAAGGMGRLDAFDQVALDWEFDLNLTRTGA